MANISVANSTYGTGGVDTRDTLDGTSTATFQQMNGAASASIAIETILGDGPTLKGNLADLVARLAVLLDADGQLKLTGFTGLTSGYGLLASSATQMAVKNIMPVGMLVPTTARTAPVHWVLANGQNLANNTYPDLLTVALDNLSNSTSTYAVGSGAGAVVFDETDVDVGADTITSTAHGLSNGDRLYFTTTTSMPGGVSANTLYYVVGATTNTFQISTTVGGGAVDITSQGGAGTNPHTYYTTFVVTDLRGHTIIGLDNMGGSDAGIITSASTNGGNADTLGGKGGAQTHTLATSQLPTHVHQQTNTGLTGPPHTPFGMNYATSANAGTAQYTALSVFADKLTSAALNTQNNTGGGGAHSNTQPWVALNYIIYAGV